MCAVNGFMIGRTWFMKRDIHKYAWVSEVNRERELWDYLSKRNREN